MNIYKNLWAGYEAYFIRMGNSGQFAKGIQVHNAHGEWRVDYNTRYYASDLRHDKDHFPIVGNIDLDAIIANSTLLCVKQPTEAPQNAVPRQNNDKTLAGDQSLC